MNRKIKFHRPSPHIQVFEKSLIVATFLGGLTIGVLTFLFQMDGSTLPKTHFLIFADYKELLVFVAGIAASFLIMSVFGIKVVLVDKRNSNEIFSLIALYSYEVGFSALALLLPLLVYPFSQIGAYIIVAIIGTWGIIFVIYKFSNWYLNSRRD